MLLTILQYIVMAFNMIKPWYVAFDSLADAMLDVVTAVIQGSGALITLLQMLLSIF